jgi:TonB family protein
MNTMIKYSASILLAATLFSCNNKSKENASTDVMANDTMVNNATTMNDMPVQNNSTTTADTMKMYGNNDTTTAKNKATTKVKKAKITLADNADPTYSKRKMDKMEMDKQGYYENVEKWPSYPGGNEAMSKFFNDNIEYPQMASENNTQGLVNISFMVDETGKVSAPTIISKKVGDGLEEEALRVFNKMPKWNPGQIKGKNVKTRYTLPVRFELE